MYIFLYISLERNPTNSSLKLFTCRSFNKTMALEFYFCFFFQGSWKNEVFVTLSIPFFSVHLIKVSTYLLYMQYSNSFLGSLDFEETFWKALFHKDLNVCLLMPTIMIQAVTHKLWLCSIFSYTLFWVIITIQF